MEFHRISIIEPHSNKDDCPDMTIAVYSVQKYFVTLGHATSGGKLLCTIIAKLSLQGQPTDLQEL